MTTPMPGHEPPLSDRPSLWELVRRIGILEDKLDEAKRRSDNTYVRKETWNESRRADEEVTRSLRAEIGHIREELDDKADADDVDAIRRADEATATRRAQLQLGLLLTAITSLVAIALAVVQILAP